MYKKSSPYLRSPELRTGPTRVLRSPQGTSVYVYADGEALLADIPGTLARGRARAAMKTYGMSVYYNLDPREQRGMVSNLLSRGMQPSAFGVVVPVADPERDFAYWADLGFDVPAELPETITVYRAELSGVGNQRPWTTSFAAAAHDAEAIAARTEFVGAVMVRTFELSLSELDWFKHSRDDNGTLTVEMGESVLGSQTRWAPARYRVAA